MLYALCSTLWFNQNFYWSLMLWWAKPSKKSRFNRWPLSTAPVGLFVTLCINRSFSIEKVCVDKHARKKVRPAQFSVIQSRLIVHWGRIISLKMPACVSAVNKAARLIRPKNVITKKRLNNRWHACVLKTIRINCPMRDLDLIKLSPR